MVEMERNKKEWDWKWITEWKEIRRKMDGKLSINIKLCVIQSEHPMNGLDRKTQWRGLDKNMDDLVCSVYSMKMTRQEDVRTSVF